MPNQKIILKGMGASNGIAKGSVRIITNKKNFSLFKEGNVLVAKITDPSYVVLISRSAAVVTDIGSLMSHPAIVSREMGVPCVVATKKATTILKNGQKIKVNGTKGIIYEAK